MTVPVGNEGWDKAFPAIERKHDMDAMVPLVVELRLYRYNVFCSDAQVGPLWYLSFNHRRIRMQA